VIRFIAALIGYYLLKFPGAILGYLIGSFIENFSSVKVESEPTYRSNNAGNSNFSESFLILTAAVLRADGSVTRSELDFVKELYKQNFGIDKTRADMLVLRDILRGEINWEAACYGINQLMIKTERVKLIHYLFGIAKADGNISPNELNIIQNIAQKINLSQYDFEFVKSKFTGTYNREFWEDYTGSSSRQQSTYYRRDDHYKALGLESTNTDEEIKTTYRKLARQYHPDKHASKSAEEIKIAEEKFKKIQQAYNEIKKERGL
jgi:DnaJ like chaperone protein